MNNVRNPAFLKALGDQIRKLRLSKNLSQEDLAGTAEIAVSQIGRIERGETNPTISTIHIISKALEIPLKKVLDFEVEANGRSKK